MGKKLIEITSDRENVLVGLKTRNNNILVVRSPLPKITDVMIEWTSDDSPMIVNVTVGKQWLKCLFASGATLTFMVNRPENTSRYSLIIDGVK